MEKEHGIIFVGILIALLLAIGGISYAYQNNETLQDDIDTVEGEAGETGPIGPAGVNGTDGLDGTDGTDGKDGTDGINGSTGSQGSTGTQGPPGQDLEPNDAPDIVDVTMTGCIVKTEYWIFNVTLDDPEDDQMKVEMYFYLNTSWLDYAPSPLDMIPWLMGDHAWIPFYNEVGYDGSYLFNATNIKTLIDSSIPGGIPDCYELKWRLDVMDGENFFSNEYLFTACPCCP